jgi:hypothetical protein
VPHRRRKGWIEAENLAAPDGKRAAVLEIHRPFIRASSASGLMERLVGRWEKRQRQKMRWACTATKHLPYNECCTTAT